jgi:hypothetical protein
METQLTEGDINAIADMVPMALRYLRNVSENTVSNGDEDENGFPLHWELARRYYAARAAVGKLLGRQSWDILSIYDDCRWAEARRLEAEQDAAT